MTLQFTRNQIILFQVVFWLVVCTLALLPIDFYHRLPALNQPVEHWPGQHILHKPYKHHRMNEWLEFGLKNLVIIAIFYLNYFWLIPNFFLKKRIKTYLFISGSLVIAVGFIPIFFDLAEHRFVFHLRPKEFHQFIIGLLATLLAILVPLAFKIAVQYGDANKERAKAEISFLRSQINHHFLFNSLNNIYSLSIKGNPKASDAIFSLSAIMRHMTISGSNNKISLEGEMDFIHHYIEIQKLRLSQNTTLHFEMRGNVKGKEISPMLLIPFIENCFKHGVSTTTASSIDIVLIVGETNIDLKTKNTIIDHIDNVNIKLGVGLENVKKRLAIEYPDHHKLSYETKAGYFYSHLIIEVS